MESKKVSGAPKAVVVGGSIAGLSCAHALISAGWQVTVIEKSSAAPSGSPTGAGLALDPQSVEIVGRWISNPDLVREITLPLPIDLGKSMTLKASDDMIQRMIEEAEKVWVPELAKVMKETKQPFINVIYDADPPTKLFWDKVVLVGDAAHPVVPNGARSTNMSIQDAETLGLCLKKWGLEDLADALREFQTIRHPVITKQVLHSRLMGLLRQGLPLQDNTAFDPKAASPEECERLQFRNMPYFEHGAPTCI
ncbi:hypothetical protein COCNU_03G016540 [Cocos nucifera]|uniref:FAD-binding domain-containing protein n=1 Tax=Cocos nucifera TaxID=13894 RepID=A0A8K0I457_COCNU|nr:hypothetical protein COCNU_03G016540 [Cocos nucifera]